MTQLLEEMVQRIQALPAEDQESFVRFILSELDEDARWADSTAAHAEGLARLTKRILEDDDKGLTEPLDPDTL